MRLSGPRSACLTGTKPRLAFPVSQRNRYGGAHLQRNIQEVETGGPAVSDHRWLGEFMTRLSYTKPCLKTTTESTR